MELAIQFDHVSRHFRDKVAIAELTLSVPAGSVFALLGENSAGKTTSLKMLMGLLQPTSGRVRLLGQDAWAHAAQLRPRLGYVPEKPRFYDWMSVAEIGWFAAGFLPAGSLERYQSWTQRLGLEPSVKLRHLSKGHYSKVALALAMAGDPEVLILDEPTSGLDLLVRREFLGSMVDLAAGGRTVVIASHQISEIERIASHVAFLSAGKLLLTAPLDDLRQRLVRVTGSGALPADLAGLGQILERRVSDGQWEMVLLDPTADALAQLEARPDLGSLATTPLSLEEAYTALLSQREAA